MQIIVLKIYSLDPPSPIRLKILVFFIKKIGPLYRRMRLISGCRRRVINSLFFKIEQCIPSHTQQHTHIWMGGAWQLNEKLLIFSAKSSVDSVFRPVNCLPGRKIKPLTINFSSYYYKTKNRVDLYI